MPPPLAVIWRTWPQILSPFTIWAVLSRLQGSFRFRLIPPSSPVACQSQTDSIRISQGGSLAIPYLFETFLGMVLWVLFCLVYIVLFPQCGQNYSTLLHSHIFWYCFHTYFVGIILLNFELL